jgi:hypothetical protein
MDSLNLLIENGCDLLRKHDNSMSSFDEILRNDNIELYECVFEYTKSIKRNLKEVLLILVFLTLIIYVGRKLFLIAFSCRQYRKQMLEIFVRERRVCKPNMQ